MFRTHTLNKRLFFTQPSLAFFDATNFKPRRTINLTPANYATEIEKNLKSDWILVPQPRPPSAIHYVIVNKKNNKVVGRMRPPLCVPFPRKYSGFSISNNASSSSSSSSSSDSSSSSHTNLTKDHLLEFHSNFSETIPSTWLLVTSERAIGTCFVDKKGNIVGDVLNFSLLCTQNAQNPGSSMSSVSVGQTKNINSSSSDEFQNNSNSNNTKNKQDTVHNNNNKKNNVNLTKGYDSPGFVRPGREAPIWREIFGWIEANHDQTLINCCNWVGRRDDWSSNVMWDDLKTYQRVFSRDERYDNIVDRVKNIHSNSDGVLGEDSETAVNTSKAAMKQAFFEENPATALGGFDEGSKEASEYRSRLAAEQRTVMDDPRWLIVPPSMMPKHEFVRSGGFHRQDEVNTVGAVGRLRVGYLDFI